MTPPFIGVHLSLLVECQASPQHPRRRIYSLLITEQQRCAHSLPIRLYDSKPAGESILLFIRLRLINSLSTPYTPRSLSLPRIDDKTNRFPVTHLRFIRIALTHIRLPDSPKLNYLLNTNTPTASSSILPDTSI